MATSNPAPPSPSKATTTSSTTHEPKDPHDIDIDIDTDTDALLAELESESTDPYTHARISQLNSELASNHAYFNHAAGQLAEGQNNTTDTTVPSESSLITTLTTDQGILDFTTKHARAVVHFSHPDFSRCLTMDAHMARLASAHAAAVTAGAVRFARIDPRAAPFVTERLKIKVLPCVLGFVDGVVVERITGFEGLGVGGYDADGEFRTARLEGRLVGCGVLLERKVGERRGDDGGETSEEEIGSDEERNLGRRKGGIRGARGGKRTVVEGESDDDWD